MGMDYINHFLKLKTPATRRVYHSIVNDFQRVTGRQILDASKRDALRYLASLDGKASATIRHRYNVLHSVCEYLVDMELLDGNPMTPAGRMISWRQAAQVRPTRVLSPVQVVRLLKLPDCKTKKGIQDKALLSLLFAGGFRRSEALALNVGDIQVNQSGIIFADLRTTKAGKRQVQPIAKFAWPALSRFISQRKQDGAGNDDPLFVFYFKDGRARNRMDERTLARRFKSYCKRVGVDAAPHSARATYATQLKAMGAQDRDVADALRHSTDQMVKVYDKRFRSLDDHAGVDLKFN